MASPSARTRASRISRASAGASCTSDAARGRRLRRRIRSARWPAIAAAQGVRLQHVKPHGALYNMAARDAALADAIARAVAGIDRRSSCSGCRVGADSRPGSAPGLRTASRGVRRSRAIAPTARWCRAATPGAVIHDADGRRCRAPSHGARAGGRRPMDGTRRSAAGRHHLRARRHAGRGGAGRAGSRSA